ncbi:MAG: hypothetical protein O3B07_07800, partial [Verrucomicrobia bacterium]|nr:hypothetical protein [Verrucomicrobiota bacterium]
MIRWIGRNHNVRVLFAFSDDLCLSHLDTHASEVHIINPHVVVIRVIGRMNGRPGEARLGD